MEDLTIPAEGTAVVFLGRGKSLYRHYKDFYIVLKMNPNFIPSNESAHKILKPYQILIMIALHHMLGNLCHRGSDIATYFGRFLSVASLILLRPHVNSQTHLSTVEYEGVKFLKPSFTVLLMPVAGNVVHKKLSVSVL